MAAKKLKPGPEPSEWARACAEMFVAEMDRVRGLLRVGDTEEAVTSALGEPRERKTESHTGTEVVSFHRRRPITLPACDWLHDEEQWRQPDVALAFDFAPGATTRSWQGSFSIFFDQYDEDDTMPTDEYQGVAEALRLLLEPRFGAGVAGDRHSKKLRSITFPAAASASSLSCEGGSAYRTQTMALRARFTAVGGA